MGIKSLAQARGQGLAPFDGLVELKLRFWYPLIFKMRLKSAPARSKQSNGVWPGGGISDRAGPPVASHLRYAANSVTLRAP
jgi:hypothetical protein